MHHWIQYTVLHTELSIHAKNYIFMKYPEWSLFSEQVTYYYYATI